MAQLPTPDPPPPVVRARLEPCSDDGPVRLRLTTIEERALLVLATAEDGAVAVRLMLQQVETPLGAAGSPTAEEHACADEAAAAAVETAEAEPAPGETPEEAAAAALQQEHEELLRENERLQSHVRQHLDGISKASRKSLQEAGGGAAEGSEQQTRYLLALQQLSSLVRQTQAAAVSAEQSVAPERARQDRASRQALAQRAALLRFVSEVAAAAGRAADSGQRSAALPAGVLQQFLAAEQDKAAQVRALRAASARLSHRLAAAERRLKEADQLSTEGLHLVDFEQTRIENAALVAKREARAAEVDKLRGKLVQAVQITAHVREKLHCAEQQRAALAAELAATEQALAAARADLSAAKSAREKWQRERSELAQDWRIVSDRRCLADMEAQKARLEGLRAQAAALQAAYEAGERQRGGRAAAK